MMSSCFKFLILNITLLMFGSMNKAQAAEDNLYDFLWLDPDKKVYVLQNKTYRKKNSLFLELSGSKILGSPFMSSFGGGAKLGYYFSEQFGIDLFYNIYSKSVTSNYEGVLLLNEGEPFVRYPKSVIGGTFLWTPFYGKVNTFNKIFYFDWGFGLGLGVLDTESNLRTAGIKSQAPKQFKKEDGFLGIVYKTDFKFHINKNFHVNIEIRNINFSAPSPGLIGSDGLREISDKKINTQTDFFFGIGYKF